MLGQRRRRWANINPTLVKFLAFDGNVCTPQKRAALTVHLKSKQLLPVCYCLPIGRQIVITAYFNKIDKKSKFASHSRIKEKTVTMVTSERRSLYVCPLYDLIFRTNTWKRWWCWRRWRRRTSNV